MVVQKKIEIEIEMEGLDKLKAALKSLNNVFDKFGLEIQQNGTILDKSTRKVLSLRKAHKRLNGTLSMSALRRTTGNLRRFNSELDKTRRKTNSAKESLGRFKMELLGIMFFGMAIAGFFTAMLQPAMDAFGVFDLISIMLMMLFLPAAQKTSEKLIGLLGVIDNLSPAQKELISTIALIGVAFGTFLFILGQVSLGFDSLWKKILVIKKAAPVIKLLGLVSKMSMGAILFWVALIIIALAALWMIWKHNFGNIREYTKIVVDGILNVVGGIITVISGILKTVAGLFEGFITGDFTMFKDGISDIMDGLKQIFVDGFANIILGVIGFGLDFTTALVNGVETALENLIEKITGKKVDIHKALMSLMPAPLRVLLKGYELFGDKIKGYLDIDTPEVKIPEVAIPEIKTDLQSQFEGTTGDDSLPTSQNITNTYTNAPNITVYGDFTDKSQQSRIVADINTIMDNEVKKLNIDSKKTGNN